MYGLIQEYQQHRRHCHLHCDNKGVKIHHIRNLGCIKDRRILQAKQMLQDTLLSQPDPAIPRQCTVLVTDAASSHEYAATALVSEYPWITWRHCSAHQCNLFIYKIATLDRLVSAIEKGKRIVTFIRGHMCLRALLKARSHLVLVRHNDTRFATNVLALWYVRISRSGLMLQHLTSKKR